MVALDEPTTNLDRANIESFAQALTRLINSLKTQSNFQLIIITHDEEFVRFIAKEGLCDYYWRVLKDDGYALLFTSRFIRLPLLLSLCVSLPPHSVSQAGLNGTRFECYSDRNNIFDPISLTFHSLCPICPNPMSISSAISLFCAGYLQNGRLC
jgi:ABC-type oligopeptide transport system ATPase subunit